MSSNLENVESQILDAKEEIRQLEWKIEHVPMPPAERSRLKDSLVLKRENLAKLERKHKRLRI